MATASPIEVDLATVSGWTRECAIQPLIDHLLTAELVTAELVVGS